MTTKVTVNSYGHNVRVTITEGESVKTEEFYGDREYYVYGARTVLVEEISGRNEEDK